MKCISPVSLNRSSLQESIHTSTRRQPPEMPADIALDNSLGAMFVGIMLSTLYDTRLMHMVTVFSSSHRKLQDTRDKLSPGVFVLHRAQCQGRSAHESLRECQHRSRYPQSSLLPSRKIACLVYIFIHEFLVNYAAADTITGPSTPYRLRFWGICTTPTQSPISATMSTSTKQTSKCYLSSLAILN